tara:strand:- start:1894 stop:2250 length:357 start_codon:yes stop_codon:yes gene_type:complete
MNEHVLLAMQSIDNHTEVSDEQVEKNSIIAEVRVEDAYAASQELTPETSHIEDYEEARKRILLTTAASSVCSRALRHRKYGPAALGLAVAIATYFEYSDECVDKYWSEIVKRRSSVII